ncbi:hypothetical protein P7K49_009474 [Saguinus oedipus]|uniref:Ig-like domain-containing protein n=1 Tax=Saguinus oedipus TaxID=9490 RepID=A0ABQ9VK35_SAGOE|nr:hypothetical protein P7K49_009474 [Saguinus oedipus]
MGFLADAVDLFMLGLRHLYALSWEGSVLAGRSAQPQSHKLQGPLQRSEPGTRIRLTYTSSGFLTNQVTVTWLKNKRELPKPQTSVRRSGHTYNVTSSVLVPLTDDDVLSHVICYVEHKLMLFFQKTIDLDQYLWVPPAVTVSQSSTSSSLVAVTCLVQRFYPQNVRLTWLEDCHTLKGTEQPTSKKNDDGSYTLENVLLVNASVQGIERVLTCMVEHEGQLPKRANLILSTAAHTTCKLIGSTGAAGDEFHSDLHLQEVEPVTGEHRMGLSLWDWVTDWQEAYRALCMV